MENMTTWLLQNPVLGVQWLSADGAFKSHLGTGDVLLQASLPCFILDDCIHRQGLVFLAAADLPWWRFDGTKAGGGPLTGSSREKGAWKNY